MLDITGNVTESSMTSDAEDFLQNNILIVFLTTTLMGTFNVVCESVWSMMVWMLFTTLRTNGSNQGQKIDLMVSSNGVCENTQISSSNLPDSGFCFLWKDGPVVLKKEKDDGRRSGSGYTVWCLRFTNSAKTMKTQLLGKDSEVSLLWMDPEGWCCGGRDMKSVLPGEARDWQRTIIERVLASYKKKNNESVLLCGPAGIGKSITAEYIAENLKRTFGIEPMVIRGISFTAKGFSFSNIPESSHKQPLIIVIDEFDSAIANAEDQDSVKKKKSISRDPTSLLNTLEMIDKLKYFVFVATTNVDLAELRKIRQGAYVRDGRFNLKFQMSSGGGDGGETKIIL